MSHLTKDFLRQQQRLLIKLRSELTGRHEQNVVAVDRDRDQLVEAGDAAQADESDHMRASLAEMGARGLTEIDAAIAKFASGQYGICELTGQPISKARLEAVPYARLSVEAQRQREINQRGRDSLRRNYGIEREAAFA